MVRWAPRVAGPREPVDPVRIGRRVVRRRAKGMAAVAVAAAAAREAELREAARIAARADELQALRELGTLEQTAPRDGDEAARDELTRRAGGYAQADVDSWLAHALAAHLGHYRDPATREEAAGLLTQPVLAHAALLTELARLVPGADIDQLALRPGSPPPSPKPPAPSPRSSPAPAPTRADLTLRTPQALRAPWEMTCEDLRNWGQKCPGSSVLPSVS